MSCYSTRNESSRQLRETCGGVGFVNTFDRSHGKIRCCREYQKAGEERTCSTSHTDEPCYEPVQARDWDGVRPIRVPSPCSLWSRRNLTFPLEVRFSLSMQVDRAAPLSEAATWLYEPLSLGIGVRAAQAPGAADPSGSPARLSLVLDHRPS